MRTRLVVVIAALLASAPARADDLGATLLECGALLAEANRTPDQADERLHDAGACFERAHDAGLAVQAYQQLVRVFPLSKLAPRAVARLGVLHARLGSYRAAAERLEEYAHKYAGEKDAIDALADALAYRAALGDDAAQLADARFLIAVYGAKSWSRAAEAMWSVLPVFERRGPAAELAHLRDYLRRFGDRGDERAVLARARLAERLGRQACPVALVDGLCVVVARERGPAVAPRRGPAVGKRCDAGRVTVRRTVVARREPAATESLAAGDAAIAAAGRLETPAVRRAVALARLARADRELEALLAIEFPPHLNFDPARRRRARHNHKRLADWFTVWTRRGGALRETYTAIAAAGDPVAAIAVAARLGQLADALGAALLTADIPHDVRSGAFAADKTAAFCDKMVEVGEPLFATAAEAYRRCVALAAEHVIAGPDDWSRSCARELARLEPAQWPEARELTARPSAAPLLLLEGP